MVLNLICDITVGKRRRVDQVAAMHQWEQPIWQHITAGTVSCLLSFDSDLSFYWLNTHQVLLYWHVYTKILYCWRLGGGGGDI